MLMSLLSVLGEIRGGRLAMVLSWWTILNHRCHSDSSLTLSRVCLSQMQGKIVPCVRRRVVCQGSETAAMLTSMEFSFVLRAKPQNTVTVWYTCKLLNGVDVHAIAIQAPKRYLPSFRIRSPKLHQHYITTQTMAYRNSFATLVFLVSSIENAFSRFELRC